MINLCAKLIPGLLFSALFFGISASICNGQVADSGSPLNIAIASIPTSNGAATQSIFVTVQDMNSSATIANITLQVWSGTQLLQSQTGGNLQPDQSRVFRFNATDSQLANLYVLAFYDVRGFSNSTVQPFNQSVMAENSSTNLLASLTPFLSLIGVVLGAWFVSYLSGRRENQRSRYEWGKVLFDKCEKPLRDFLNNWGKTPTSILLRNQFETLQANCFVPKSISNAYRKTYGILSDPTASEAEKKKSCEDLERSVEHFVHEPWEGSR